MEGNCTSQSVTMEMFGNQDGQPEVALRKVPIVLKNGNRRVVVNYLLDEGSEDVVNELGLTGQKESITVNVTNDQMTIRLALKVRTVG